MNKKGFIGLIVVIVAVVVVGFFLFIAKWNSEDAVCVPASCCHATSCVLESETPDCSGRLCTMDCRPGTLDCEQARCEYIDDGCEVVLND